MIAALRNLQEDANRAARSRGVQVYSPTRALPGGMANSTTAARIGGYQGSQTPQRAGGPSNFGGFGAPRTPLRPLPTWQAPTGTEPGMVPGQVQPMTTLDDMVRRAAGLGTATPAPQQGGLLGSVVNSLPGKAIMGGLELLDRPRRIIISSLQETVDAVNGGNASFNDWANQINDPSFGFGDVIGDTGSKWGNRILGFVGDVLLDPLTYVAGSSVISGSGRRLRTDLAARMVSAGIEESIAQRVAKLGFQSLDNDTRALIKEAGITGSESLLNRGYYFSVPWGPRMRLPLSGKIDEVIGGLFSGTRANVADTRFGTWMRHTRTEAGITDAVDRMVTGNGKMSFAEAAERVNFRRTYSQVSRSATNQQAHLAQRYLKEHGARGLNASMTLASGGPAREYFRAVRTLLTTKYHLVIPELEDYLPRVYTDRGLNWVLKDPQAEQLRSVLYKEIDFNDPSPVLMHRMFKPRDEPYMIGAKKVTKTVDGKEVTEWVGGKPLYIKTGTPAELNEQFAKLVPEAGYKLVDDDFSSLAARYAKSIEGEVGVRGGINALIGSKSGLVRRLDDASVVELITDGDLVRHFSDEKVAQLKAQLQAANSVTEKIRDDTLKGVSGIQGAFGVEMRGALEELRVVEPKKWQRMQELLAQIEGLEKERGVAAATPTTLTGDLGISEGGIWDVGASGDITRGVGTEGPTGELMRAFDAEIETLDDRFYALQERLAEVQPDAIREAEALEAMLTEATARKIDELAPTKTAAYEEFQRLAAEAAAVIEDIDVLSTLRSRVLSNSMAADYIDSWVSDNAFQNLALAASENPLAMFDLPDGVGDPRVVWQTDPVTGQRTAANVQVRAGVVPVNDRSYTAVLQSSQAKRTQLLALALQSGADTPRGLTGNSNLDRLIGLTEAQIDTVVRARRGVEEQARIFNAGIRGRREDLNAVRRVEAGLNAKLAWDSEIRGDPSKWHLVIEAQQRRGALRAKGGPLDQAQQAYDAARAPLKEATQRLENEQRMLRGLQREQEEVARTALIERLGSNKLRIPKANTDQYPLTFADERSLRRDLAHMERDRRKMARDGTDGRPAREAHAANQKQLTDVDDFIHRNAADPRAPFFLDEAGNVQLKRTNAQQVKLVNQRDEVVNNLLPRAEQELNDARAALNSYNHRVSRQEVEAAGQIGRPKPTRAEVNAARRSLSGPDSRTLTVQQRAEAKAVLVAASQKPGITKKAAAEARTGLKAKITAAAANVDKVQARIARLNDNIARSGGLGTPEEIAAMTRLYGGPKNRTWRAGTLKRLQEAVAKRGELLANAERLKSAADVESVAAGQLDESIASATRQLADQDQVRARMGQVETKPTPLQHFNDRLIEVRNAEQSEWDRITRSGEQFKTDWADVDELPPTHYPPEAWELPIEHPLVSEALGRIRGTLGRSERLLGLNPVDDIERALIDLDIAARPFRPTPKQVDVVNWPGPVQKGGSVSVVDRAKLAIGVADEALEHHAEALVSHKALLPGDVALVRDMSAQIKRTLDLYAKAPTPYLRMDIEQRAADLGRWGRFMHVYKGVVDAGIEPSDNLSAYLVARQFTREIDSLNGQIGRVSALIRDEGEALKLAKFQQEMIVHQNQMEAAQVVIQREIASERETGIWNKRAKKRAQDSYYWHSKQLETKVPPEFGGLIDDIDNITNLLYGLIRDLDVANQSAKNAENAQHFINWPNNQRVRLEAQMPMKAAQNAEAAAATVRLAKAIDEAVASGSDTVTFTDWTWARHEAATPELAQARAAEFKKQGLTAEIERRAAKQATRKTSKTGTPPPIAWSTKVPKAETTTLSMEAAQRSLNKRMADQVRAQVEMRNLADELKLLDGTGATEVATLKQLISDAANPDAVDVEQLTARNNQIRQEALAEGRGDKLSSAEMSEIQLNSYRIERKGIGPPTAEELAEAHERIDFMEAKALEITNTKLGNMKAANAIVDGGQMFLDQLAKGNRALTKEEAQIVVDLVGPDAAALGISFMNSLHETIAGRTTLTIQESAEVVDTLRQIYGDNKMVDKLRARISRELASGEGGNVSIEELTRHSMPEEAFESTEQMASEGVLSADYTGVEGEQFQKVMSASVRTDWLTSETSQTLYASAQAYKFATMRAMEDHLDLLGFSFSRGETVSQVQRKIEDLNRLIQREARDPTDKEQALLDKWGRQATQAGEQTYLDDVQSRVRALGYDMNRKNQLNTDEGAAWVKQRVRHFVTGQLFDAGYNPAKGLPIQLENLQLRRQRLETMRRGLGMQLAMQPVLDPDQWFEMMMRDGPVSFSQSLREAEEFTRIAIPEDVGQTLDNRIVGLQNAMNEASLDGDTELVEKISAELNEIEYGRVSANPPEAPTPARIAPPSEEVGPLQVQRDAARSDVERIDQEIASHQRMAVSTEQAAPAESLDAVVAAGPRPPTDNLHTQADILKTQRLWEDATEQLQAFGDEVPPEFMTGYEALTDEMSRMTHNAWMDEPAEWQTRAHAAYEGESGTAQAVSSADAHAAQLTDLQGQRATAQEALDEAERRLEELAVRQPVVESELPVLGLDDIPSTTAPDAVPTQREQPDVMRPDEELTPTQILTEYKETIERYNAIRGRVGDSADLPPEVIKEMETLAQRATNLARMQHEGMRTRVAAMPEYQQYVSQLHAQAIPSVTLNWRRTMKEGAPPANMVRDMLQHNLGRALTEVPRATRSHQFLRDSLPWQEAKLQARKGPLGSEMDWYESAAVRARREASKAQRQIGKQFGEPEVARTARMTELQKTMNQQPDVSDVRAQHAASVAESRAEYDEIRAQQLEILSERDRVEQEYTNRLSEIDSNLADARNEVMRVSRDYEHTVAERQRLERALETVPHPDNVKDLVADLRDMNAARAAYGVAARDTIAADRAARNAAQGEVTRLQGEITALEAAAPPAAAAAPPAAAAAPPSVGPVRALPANVPPEVKELERIYREARAAEYAAEDAKVPLDQLLPLRDASTRAWLELTPHLNRAGGGPPVHGPDIAGAQRNAETAALNAMHGAPPAAAAPPTPPVEPPELDRLRRQLAAAQARLDVSERKLASTVSAAPEGASIEATEAMLNAAAKSAHDLEQAQIAESTIAESIERFENGAEMVAPVMSRLIVDHWKPLMQHLGKEGWKQVGATHMRGVDAVIMAQSLATGIENITRAFARPDTWKFLDKYTAFFKTYATARPGFHVRNGMSAMFMNLVDNVKGRHMYRSMGLWKQYTQDPIGFLERAESQIIGPNGGTLADAFHAVFGSGSSGQFGEHGVGTATTAGSIVFQKLMNNRITRWNRRVGSHVEGTARLAMALDSIARGDPVGAAMERIRKFHFDYQELSEIDHQARRLIPFWTFMSRNLPLQIEMMWTRPRTYLQYQSFVRNFREEGDPLTPAYWLAQGAFTMDENAASKDEAWYLAPDLPHLRVAEPLEALAQGDLGKALLSDINPAISAPIEAFAAGRKFYTGSPIDENRPTPVEGTMKLLTPIFNMLGATSQGGVSGETLVDPRWQHMARTLNPILDITERLTSSTGVREGREGETWARFLGAPVYKQTEAVRESERNRRFYERRDERDQQARIARS